MRVQGLSGIHGSLSQAGLIGTDLLSQHVVTLDPPGGTIHRSSRGRFCSDAVLRAAGFRPLSSRGYSSHRPASLICPAGGRALEHLQPRQLR